MKISMTAFNEMKIFQDLHGAWQMAKLAEVEPAASEAFKSRNNHSWYLDPSVVPFVLANSDLSLPCEEKEAMAKKIFNTERPGSYDLNRRNNTGFLKGQDEMAALSERPSLVDFISPESWLTFDILDQDMRKCKWM